jgi:hypothetical protein
MAQLPMSEERRICAAKPIKPVARSFGLATQPLKFAARPADDIEINPLKEAKLIALACSKPPKGRARWTLRLLENKVVDPHRPRADT